MPRVAKVERKTEYFPIVGEVKATNDQQGIIEGYLNYCSNVDFGDDRTMPGAFKTTLRDSYARKSAQGLDFLFPYLWNHDYSQVPPGGIFDAEEDKKGLYTKTRFNLDMESGRDLYSSFKMGTLKKQSMGYKAIRYEYVQEDKRTIRNLLEVAVVEGSAVVFPMNDLAQVNTIKGLVPSAKDFNATYSQRLQEDWLDDFWLLFYSLKSEIFQALRDGTTPMETIQTALDQFNQAMLAYVQQGLDIGIVQALGGDMFYYMASDEGYEGKAGRVLSDKNHKMLTTAADGIMSHCKSIQSLLKSAQQQSSAVGAAEPPHDVKTLTDDAVSTHLDGLLQSLSIDNLFKQLK